MRRLENEAICPGLRVGLSGPCTIYLERPLEVWQRITYLEENLNQSRDDTLMMTVMPLAKIGRLLNRPQYVEEVKRKFLLHIQYLHDPSTGLFFHGWQLDGKALGGVGHNIARARWARGNSWITIAIPDSIELLNLRPDDDLRMYLIGVLEAQ